MFGRFASRAIGIFIMTSVASLGWAQAAPAPLSPDQSIQQPTEQMRALIKQNAAAYRADKAKFYTAVDSILVPHFDVPYIAREVLGRYGRTATADQLQRFADAFQNMLVRSYADQLLEDNDTTKLSFQTAKMDSADPGDASVNVTLTRPNAKPLQIGFDLHLVSGQWKIIDINAEGLSLVINFRTQVASQIKQSSIDDVITKMQSGQLGQQQPAPAAPKKGQASR